MSTTGPSTSGGNVNALLEVITEQAERLRAAQKTHGDFHVQVTDDLKQLALLFVMNGEHDKALPLLHQRLVIHEKHGPDELTAEVLQELGTVYRLHGMRDIAMQHLLRALTLREQCFGENSLKVAETLNSLAVVSQINGEMEEAETYQLRSLQVLYDSAEPEDFGSEDIPWEVYKRLKQQHGPSSAATSITFFKDKMRKSVMDVVYESAGALSSTKDFVSADNRDTLELKDNAKMDTLTSEQVGVKLQLFQTDPVVDDNANAEYTQLAQSRINSTLSQNARSHCDVATSSNAEKYSIDDNIRHQSLSAVSVFQSINDLPTLQQRVESTKRRILAGSPDVNDDVERLIADVEHIQARELREAGIIMVALVHDLKRLCIRTNLTQQQLPILEGLLEKKSASIFRGWEKRWFKFDSKTFILSYHFSKDDDVRGFTPRGGFAISRVSNILVHRHARGGQFYFDVIVDLSTHLNPQGSRTYELRCEDETSLRYWVETLHYYKAIAQKIPSRP